MCDLRNPLWKLVPASSRSVGSLGACLAALGLVAALGVTSAGAAILGDPVRLPGSFVGGGNDVEGIDVTVAPNGDLILVGDAVATDLPVTDASTHAGGKDVFVARFDTKVRTLKWLIYLGGSNDDEAAAVAVDASGNVYVAGSTLSTDFPTVSAYDASANGGGDAFVAKLAAANGAHTWVTYLGGTGGDTARDIVVDGSDRAIVVGTTSSSNFPTASPFGSDAYLTDAFVTRFAANGASLELSSYYGDARREVAVAVDVDAENDIYVGVHGRDHEMPYQLNEILKIDGSAKTLTWAYVLDPSPPGWSIESVLLEDIAVTAGGVVAFAGTLESGQATLPMVNPWQPSAGGDFDFFVGKLNSAGNAIDWSTYLGGSGGEGPVSIALGSDEKVWIAGGSDSADYPTLTSFFPMGGAVSQLAADGQSLLFSTRIGGWATDEFSGIALASDSVPVVSGTVGWEFSDLPLTGLLPPSVWYNAFVARVQPLPSGRFLPRRSVALPPLDRAVEPFPWGALDLDGDGDSETYLELPDRSLDLAWGNVVVDRKGDGQDLLTVAIGTLGGARVVGGIDQDGDGEVELVVEDPRLDAGTVQGWLLDQRDADVDLIVVGRGGAGGALLVDLDGDGDQEVVVGAPHLADGLVSRMDLEPDGDFDVLLIGGLPRAILDADGDGELEVIAERGGTSGTTSTGSVEATPDLDVDVIFLAGTYAFARDLDGDGIPEIFAEDPGASPGSVAFTAPVAFVGGGPETAANVDGDDDAELIVSDATAADGTFDPFDALDGTDGDLDVVFVGGAFRGAADVDGDWEAEMIVEDTGGTADTFGEVDGIETPGDGDPDLIAIRGLAAAVVDTDDDGELEIVADSGAQTAGAFLELDGAESPGDGDADVVFVGGVTAASGDLDEDWEAEVVVEDGAAGSGTFDGADGIESPSDGDADIVFIAGTWRAIRDLDQDGENEVVSEDSGLGSAASAAGGMESPSDGDSDVAFVEASFLAIGDFDGDGEPEVVVEDGGLTAPTVGYAGFIEGDGDNDLVAVPTTAGWRMGDFDGDREVELALEHTGATAGATTKVGGVEAGPDGDGDVLFVGGVPAVVTDLDGDSENELVVSSTISAGSVSTFDAVEAPVDGDADIVYVGGTARGYFDADGDWENEVVVENGSGGSSSRYDNVDGGGDPDVLFVGGRVRYLADVDYDGEMEAIAESSSAPPGNSSRYNGGDDGDADVIYVAGSIQGEGDLDGDGEPEIAVTDANLAGGTAVDPIGWDGDTDPDGALIGIDSSTGSPSLTLTAPNGGGSVTLGNPLSITWSASGFAGTVRIELSRDGGTTWETLFANTDNDGSEVWTSDGSPTSTALIRVTSRNLATPVSDASNATFTLI